ncbi:hypothetical protein J4463_01345 [Candidatus Pacearchaeota archaeon]|nr:hypothetical protein [Candidatus Pacearchaeota archaeon]
MKRLFIALITFFILIQAASAIESYQAEYILEKNYASVNLGFELAEKDYFEWNLPDDANEISANVKYEVIDLKSYKKLQTKDKASWINIKYRTSTVIERTKNDFFILDLSDIDAKIMDVKLKLPEGAFLEYDSSSKKNSIIPKTQFVGIDGKRIIIEWKDISKNAAILVIYNAGMNYAILIYSFIAIASAIAIAFILGIKLKKKIVKNDLTKNLFEEEKQITEILIKCGEMWQKQLEIKSGISKVKLSRKLRALEQKGIIEKIPYGNTNKIRIKG